MLTLPIVRVMDVCKHGKGFKQCRYLGQNPEHDVLWYCLKTEPIYKQILDKECDQFIVQERERVKQGKNANDTFPLGDNCGGWSLEDATYLCEYGEG